MEVLCNASSTAGPLRASGAGGMRLSQSRVCVSSSGHLGNLSLSCLKKAGSFRPEIVTRNYWLQQRAGALGFGYRVGGGGGTFNFLWILHVATYSTGVSPVNNLIDGCRRRNNLAESCGNVNVKQRKRDWQTGRLCSEKGPSNISCAGCCSAGPCVPQTSVGCRTRARARTRA